METNLENKYKDNIPKKTIENIVNFFNSKGYQTEIAELKNPISNIWWCKINLKYNNILLTDASGKGTSKEYALASGYSELYERYCCIFNFMINSKINNEKLHSICKKERGYTYPDEVYLSISDAINATPQIKNFYDSINDNCNSLIQFLESNNPNGLLSLPFKSFNKEGSINIPFELMKYS